MALMHCNFHSTVLGMAVSMDVILPQQPYPAREDRVPLPTLYLLHGLGDDHTIWQRRTSIERYTASLNLAVVMPAVHRSFYTDMARGYRYWTFVSEELPALARCFFPLSAARKDNFVAGLSMGGYGAFKMALSHPERFAAAASLSGALDVAAYTREASANGGDEPRNIFGDDLAVVGSRHDLFCLADRLAEREKKERPRLYQWCGTEDFLYQDNILFRDHAAALKLDLLYEEGPGGHDWACWDRQIQRVLEWLPLRG